MLLKVSKIAKKGDLKGQRPKICEGFCQTMADSNTISGSTLSILMLDQFSRHRKVHPEQAHPMDSSTKQYDYFLKIQWFKVRPIVKFEIGLTLNHCIFKK